MKKNMLLFFLCAFVSLWQILSAQTTEKWEQAIGGPGNDYGYSVKSCLGQGYIVAGSTASSGISDGYLIRTDSLGLVMWSKYFRGNNVDVYRSVKILPDSGFIVAGFSNSTGTHGGYDGYVERMDKNGDSLWAKFFGTSDWEFFYDITPTYDGGFMLAGGTYGLGMGDEDFYVVKIDSLGNLIWQRTYGGAKQDEARSIIQTGDSMIAVAGFTYSLADTLGDSWILRLDQFGATIWSRTAGYNNAEDKAWSVADNYTTGRILFCGQNQSIPGNNEDPDFGAFFYNGSNQFVITNGGLQDEMFYQIVGLADGNMVTVGANYTVGGGHGDLFFFQTNPFQSFTFGTSGIEVGYGIDLTNDKGYIACGSTDGFNCILPNVYLVKIDSNGTSTGVLAVREISSSSTLGSVNVFPNPGRDNVTVSFDSYQSHNGDLEMKVYDISGRLITSVPNWKWEILSDKSAVCKIETDKFEEGCYQYIITDQSGGKISGKFIIAR